jgi:hypothetical protein
VSDPKPPAPDAISVARLRLDRARHRLRESETDETHREYDTCLAAYREALYGGPSPA